MNAAPANQPSDAVAQIGALRLPITGGNFVSSLNEPDRARFTVAVAPDLEIDYLAPVKVEIDGHPMIEGSVVAAYPEGDSIEIHAQSAIAMSEEKMHGMVVQEFHPADVAYAIARRSGFDEDNINIHDLDRLPFEVFEIVVGIEGIDAVKPLRIGTTTFVDPAAGRRILDQFDPQPEWAPEFEAAPAHALVYVTAQRMHDAQQQALAEVDVALSWLAIRSRYGLNHLPDTTLHRYERSESNATPSRRELVAVRGLQTSRRWIQRLGPRLRSSPMRLDARSRLDQPTLPRGLRLQQRQAMLSAQRALSEEDPIQRSQALWEALEFYLAGRPSESLFSRTERRQLLASLRSAVPTEQRQRVADLLNWVDSPPPKQALARAVQAEGIPLSEPEFDLLFRIRTARNRATHGADVQIPSTDELDYACSILARILVYWIDSLVGGDGNRCSAAARRTPPATIEKGNKRGTP